MGDDFNLAVILIQALATGGGVWVALRVEVRLLWMQHKTTREDLRRLEDRVNRLVENRQ